MQAVKEMNEVKKDNFWKKMIMIAGPVMLQQIINLGVNLTDNIMVGSLREEAIDGVASGNQFYFLFNIFCLGLGGGSAVVVSQLWGKRDVLSIKKVITLMLRICIAVSAVFMAVSLFVPELVMSVLTPEEGIIKQGAMYIRMMSMVYLIHGIALVMTIVYRSVGVVMLALVSSICSFGINIFFNWVFIFGKFGMPKMGVRGAALGTFLSRLVEFLIIIIYLLCKDKKVQYKIKDIFMPCKEMAKTFLSISVPVIISDVILQLGNIAITMIMGRMENRTEMLAANSITATTVQISTFLLLGMANASSVMVGNSIGEGKIERAKAYGKRFLYISIAVGAFGALIIRFIGPVIMNFYNITEDTKACTQSLIEAISFILVFQAISSVLTKGVLRGGGDTKFLMLADVLFLWIASVPLGAIAGLWLQLDAFWVYVAVKIDLVIKAIWCIIRLYRGKWLKRV